MVYTDDMVYTVDHEAEGLKGTEGAVEDEGDEGDEEAEGAQGADKTDLYCDIVRTPLEKGASEQKFGVDGLWIPLREDIN